MNVLNNVMNNNIINIIMNRVAPDLTFPNLAGSGARFGRNLFLGHRTIHQR